MTIVSPTVNLHFFYVFIKDRLLGGTLLTGALISDASYQYIMQNSYIIEPANDSTITTVSQQREQEAYNNGKATESTSLTPNNNQAYFADEKIPVPKTDNVIELSR